MSFAVNCVFPNKLPKYLMIENSNQGWTAKKANVSIKLYQTDRNLSSKIS